MQFFIQNMCIIGCANFSINIVTFICVKLETSLKSSMYCFISGALVLQMHLLFTKFIYRRAQLQALETIKNVTERDRLCFIAQKLRRHNSLFLNRI